ERGNPGRLRRSDHTSHAKIISSVTSSYGTALSWDVDGRQGEVMYNRDRYDATTVDWARLHRYAQHVASQTRKPPEHSLTYEVSSTRRVSRRVRKQYGPFGIFSKVVNEYVDEQTTQQVSVIGQHWVLGGPWEANITEGLPAGGEESTHSNSWIVLLADGSLKHVYIQREEVWVPCGGGLPTTYTHGMSDMGEQDLRMFDCKNEYYSSSGKKTIWRNDIPGDELVVQAKGVGIFLVLKQLLEY
ncbi:hypothetical protein, partial [Streptomyces bacillaris]|uniref:hypothetical protein n=1 Tax=Streptomyces bacillaris TaxID=68179 RepID=UPI003802343E